MQLSVVTVMDRLVNVYCSVRGGTTADLSPALADHNGGLAVDFRIT